MQSLVSELAGEAVEPAYNFLSLYTQLGICEPHMDAPKAKWTLDVCIEQSSAWPIYFSQTVPWPEDFSYSGKDWQEYIKDQSDLRFNSCSLHPGEAVLFSGSSQWHYRDGYSGLGNNSFCNLLFFHFLPEGTRKIVEPTNWPELFEMPALVHIVGERG